jgi:glycine cleavage system H protein
MDSIPENRKYTINHIWIVMEDEFIGRCGISDMYLEKLDIIEFVEFPEIDWEVRMGGKIGVVESGKAFFNITAAVSGRIVDINRNLEMSPSDINTDPYGEGWIYKIDVNKPAEFLELLDERQYMDYITRG